jgi:hypothetical protein
VLNTEIVSHTQSVKSDALQSSVLDADCLIVQGTVALFLNVINLPELFETAVPAGIVSTCDAVLQENTTTRSLAPVVAVAVLEVNLYQIELQIVDAAVVAIEVCVWLPAAALVAPVPIHRGI